MKNEPSTLILKRVDGALISVSNKLRLKKSNRQILLDFCGCVREIFSQSHNQ